MGEQIFTMKSEVFGWPFVVVVLVQNVDQKVCEGRHFTILELSSEIPQLSHPVPYDINRVRLGYHKLCARWVLVMLRIVHKTQRIVSVLTF
jgi:hypothetical protein